MRTIPGCLTGFRGSSEMPQHRRSPRAADEWLETLSPTLNTVYAPPGMLELLTFRGHKDWVFSAAFSPNGRRIVTDSGDGTVKVWEAATRDKVANWHEEERTAAAVEPGASQSALSPFLHHSPIDFRKFRYFPRQNVL